MSESYADIDSVLRRLNHEIRRTVGNETKMVAVHRDDLIDAIRAINILRVELKEMNDFISSRLTMVDIERNGK